MQSHPTRRRYVQLLGVSVALGLAGCTGDPDDEGSAGNDDASGSVDDSDGMPADDSGGADDGNDGGTVDDGDDSGAADDGEADETADDDSESGGSGDNPRLRDVFNWDDSYVMEMTAPEGTARTVAHRGDTFTRWSSDEGTFEMYRIGDDNYTVIDDRCFKSSFDTPADDTFDPEEPEQDDQEYFASGTNTVNGERVYEFLIEEGRYYLSVATGYPVRWENDEGVTVDFHSWGDTDPISPPDMECTSQ